MQIIKEQLGRINHFLIIMIPLFIVNALFNLKYDWGGFSAIARVYILVLSFYLTFIFSQINADDYRPDYNKKYGWKGKYYLFFVLRLFPFVFIYFLTIVFTLINYLNTPNWPIEPVLRLLDGRYSNTIFYALILFVILKQKKRPGISIPLFIICSILYYKTDRVLYGLLDPGPGVGMIKLSKYFIFIFILIYGYSKSRLVLFHSVLLSILTGFVLFATISSFLIISFLTSPPGSKSLSISGYILLKSGFVFPLEKLQKNILEYGTPEDMEDIFYYMEKYGEKTSYTSTEWETLILTNKIGSIEYIFRYLNKMNIRLNFDILKNYTVSQLGKPATEKIDVKEFTRYLGSYYNDNKNEFYELYRSGAEPVKITVLNSLAYTDDLDALYFLIDKITSVERQRSEAAYNSLKIITGEDPASNLSREKYDIEVVLFFRDYALKKKK